MKSFSYLGVGPHEQKFITRSKVESLKEYLAAHAVVQFKKFLIDADRVVRARWQCRFQKCVEINGRNCCDGPTHALPDWQIERINRDLERIVGYLPSDRKREIERTGVWEKTGATRVFQGMCIFWYRTTGKQERCALQTFAQRHGADLYSLKPFSCSLYPMEAISIDGKIFLTSYLPPDQPFRFGRWQYRDQWDNICFSEKFRKSAPPVYRSLAPFIRYTFGEELLDELQELEG